MISIVAYTNGLYGLSSTRYSPTLREKAKQTPGLHWQPEARAWCGYADAVAACAMQLEVDGIVVDGSVPHMWDFNLAKHKSKLDGLRDYQKAGVCFLIEQAVNGALLADDMGLGKTRQALHTISLLQKPAVVVCPSFVRGVWANEVKKWLPKYHLIQLAGTKPTDEEKDIRANSPATIYLCHYDVVYAWVESLKAAGVAIFIADECHFLMGENSRRSKACKELARNCDYRIGLSGTPMTSRPKDLWNVVDTLSENRFGNPFKFFLRYCDAHKVSIQTRDGSRVVWDLKGASNLDELQERMKYFMLRRTKSEVQLELPPRTRQVVEVEVAKKLQGKIAEALKGDRAMRAALGNAADGKLPRVAELVLNHVESRSKVIVGCWRKAVAEAIAALLRAEGISKTRVITGDESIKSRQATIEEQPDVICCTMASTSVGIDLSFADVGVVAELDYVPSTLSQWESRLHRFGQKKNVLIQYVIALSTADEIIRDVVIGKLAVFEKGIGKTDDKLRADLEGAKLTNVQQLKSLYEKILKQESRP